MAQGQKHSPVSLAFRLFKEEKNTNYSRQI
jgi:hypothetical protein